MRRRGGRGENHVSFQRIAVVRRSRGEPAQSRIDPEPTSDCVGDWEWVLKSRSYPLTDACRFGILPMRSGRGSPCNSIN
jgi:hypothetical protein